MKKKKQIGKTKKSKKNLGKTIPLSKIIFAKRPPIKYIQVVPTPPTKKKIKPMLPDINTALIRYRNDAMKHYKKYMESLVRLNTMLPNEYRIDLGAPFEYSLYLIERQIGKFRSDYWAKEEDVE